MKGRPGGRPFAFLPSRHLSVVVAVEARVKIGIVAADIIIVRAEQSRAFAAAGLEGAAGPGATDVVDAGLTREITACGITAATPRHLSEPAGRRIGIVTSIG